MKNVGMLDKRIRYLIGAILIGVGVFLGPTSELAFTLYVVAAVLIVTSAVGFCGLYKLIGINTCPLEDRKK